MAPRWRFAAPVTVRPSCSSTAPSATRTPSPSRGTAGRAALGLGLLSQGSRPQRRRARLHLPPRGGRRLGRPHRRRRPCPPFRPSQWRCLPTVGRHAGILVAVTRALQAVAIDRLDAGFIDGLIDEMETALDAGHPDRTLEAVPAARRHRRRGGAGPSDAGAGVGEDAGRRSPRPGFLGGSGVSKSAIMAILQESNVCEHVDLGHVRHQVTHHPKVCRHTPWPAPSRREMGR